MRILVALHQLSAHIDGSSVPPSATIVDNDKSVPNPDLASWIVSDQKAALLLLSSLTEEAAAEVLGLTTARQIWLALENAYNNASVERVQSLRDSLRQLTKGNATVTDFSRRFRIICEQLGAIGHPVADIDKLHWFLCGLGPSYEVFSTAIRAAKPAPVFRDLVAQAESHELFLQSLHGTAAPPAAFHAQNRQSSVQSRGRSSFPRGNASRGRGRGQPRRPPHCQLCRTTGHYASACPNLQSYATKASALDENLAKAFHAQCHVHNTNAPDWIGDSGATDHMAPNQDALHNSTFYTGSENKSGSRKGLVKMDSMCSRMNPKFLLLKFLIRPLMSYGTLV